MPSIVGYVPTGSELHHVRPISVSQGEPAGQIRLVVVAQDRVQGGVNLLIGFNPLLWQFLGLQLVLEKFLFCFCRFFRLFALLEKFVSNAADVQRLGEADDCRSANGEGLRNAPQGHPINLKRPGHQKEARVELLKENYTLAPKPARKDD